MGYKAPDDEESNKQEAVEELFAMFGADGLIK